MFWSGRAETNTSRAALRERGSLAGGADRSRDLEIPTSALRAALEVRNGSLDSNHALDVPSMSG